MTSSTRADGLRVASPLRMLFGLAEQFNQHRFRASRRGRLAARDRHARPAGDYLAAVRRSGRPGVIRLEAWLEQISFLERPAQTGLELDFVEMIERVGLPAPVRQHPLRLANGELIHLDLAWPAARLAVEPGHSRWHVDVAKDQARDRACSVVGWQVERYDQDGAAGQARHRARDPGDPSPADRRSRRFLVEFVPLSAHKCRQNQSDQARAAVTRLVKWVRPSGRRWMPSP